MDKIKVERFSLEQTLECGQCFHFQKVEDNHYVFVVGKKAYDISQDGEILNLHNISEEEFMNELYDYFDLGTDYKYIQDYLCKKDEKLKTSVQEMSGIKILKQEFFETLISFIISANNHISRIKKSVAEISKNYGEHIDTLSGVQCYSFPNADSLIKVSADELRATGIGFRDKYIMDACDKYLNGVISETYLRNCSEQEAYDHLMQIKGVGIKVASCVTLFSLSKMQAFPIDVWIKRIMQNYYFDGNETKNEDILKFARELYAPYEGYAQQYLFHYGRSKGNKK